MIKLINNINKPFVFPSVDMSTGNIPKLMGIGIGPGAIAAIGKDGRGAIDVTGAMGVTAPVCVRGATGGTVTGATGAIAKGKIICMAGGASGIA